MRMPDSTELTERHGIGTSSPQQLLLVGTLAALVFLGAQASTTHAEARQTMG